MIANACQVALDDGVTDFTDSFCRGQVCILVNKSSYAGAGHVFRVWVFSAEVVCTNRINISGGRLVDRLCMFNAIISVTINFNIRAKTRPQKNAQRNRSHAFFIGLNDNWQASAIVLENGKKT